MYIKNRVKIGFLSYYNYSFYLIEKNAMFPCDIEALKEGENVHKCYRKMFLFLFVFEQKTFIKWSYLVFEPHCLKMLNQIPACNNFKKPIYLILNVLSIIIQQEYILFLFSPSKNSSFSLCLASSKRFILLIDHNQ